MSKNFYVCSIIYFLIYIGLGCLYALQQWVWVCADMHGFKCSFNEDKLTSFLTLISYIITPLVALYIFSSWKFQANNELKQKIVLKINDHLRIMSAISYRNHTLYNRIYYDKENKINYKFNIDIEENEKFRVVTGELLSLLKDLYFLTKDSNYIESREKLGKYTQNIPVYLKEINQIFQEKTREEDVHQKIYNYLDKSVEIIYGNSLVNEKFTKEVKATINKKDIFINSYNIQNDITNYILKKDFGIK